VSTGKISAIIHEAGEKAQEYLKRCIPQETKALALDEQYANERGKAYLNIVDVHSGLVVASIAPVAVDTESWMLLLWQLQEQGFQWNMTVSDGGKAIADAVHKVAPESIHQRDVWHVLHECQKVQGRFNRAVDPVAHAKDVRQMEYIASSFCYLTGELKILLGVVVLKEQSILGTKERQEELDTLLDLFSEVCETAPKSIKEDGKKLVRHVQLALPGLVSFCPELDAVQQQAIDQLGEAAVHLIGWAWLRRAILEPKSEKLAADFVPAWQPVVRELFEAWNEAVRSSSAVENWHSILRPFIAVHRSLSADMLAILAVWHNHRVPSRGLHQGQSPLIRSGLAKEPTDWLVALGYPPASSSPGQAQCSIVSSEPKMESIAA
jgi:hypothetical protein